MNRSDIIRRAVVDLFREWSDELPDWVQREASHEDMVKRNNPELRVMHFKQRVFDYAQNTLTNDMGRIARYPPKPDRLERHYGQMLREEVEKEAYPEYAEEFEEHIGEVMQWYRIMHPDTEDGTVRGQAVTLAAWHIEAGREQTARGICSKAGAQTNETEHVMMDDARSKAKRWDWRHEQDTTIRTDTDQ